MSETHPKAANYLSRKSRDVLLLITWSIVLFLCASTLKNYYLNGQPPLWDNLSYQQQTLRILTNWLDGNWIAALVEIWDAMTPAYLISLAVSFMLFGFNPITPYIVSAFFGSACLVAIYLICRELGPGKRTAFWGVVAFSLLPNFIYQNFLQTRNDFPLAFFFALSWLFLLRAIKTKDSKLTFYAGVIAGIGTLFKASAPGYVIWGILVFFVMPEKYIQINLKDRMKLILLFAGGAVLSCGWHFLPHLGPTLNYYAHWGNATKWVSSQYNLQGNWIDFFFYLRNIIFIHLGKKVSIGITLVGGILLIRWFVIKRSINFTKKNSKESPLIFLVLMAGILPIIFISLKGSYASVGDIPTLPLLVAGGLTLGSRIAEEITIPRVFLLSLLPICLILSISNLAIIERQFSGKDIEMLSLETMKIRKKFGLGNTAMIQVFSHPIYNVDALAYFWLMDLKTDREFVHHPKITQQKIIRPKDAEGIASQLSENYSLLILSTFSGTTIQGEKFNTLNRLHSKINAALENQGQFVKIRSLELEGGRFPIRFMLNKNFSVLRSTYTTIDNWAKWGGEVNYFSLKQTKLIWRAVPIRKMDSFKLVDKDNRTSFIKMTLNKILPNGKYEYQSEMVPATDKLIKFILTPESSDFLLPASKVDKRMLAFNQVETEVLQYE